MDALVEELLRDGTDPSSVLAECREGMRLVGERYEATDYYVSDLMMASTIFKKVIARLEPLTAGQAAATRGKVVAGTVKGDIHDIGKDLVVSTLRAAGYDVTDLGINVEPRAFVQTLEDTGASVLALSGLLTISFDPMKETVEAVEAAGLRPGVKIMLGGGPVTESVRVYAGADALGADPPAAVRLADGWTEAAR
ncbi:MAG: cobalamin-dependent protein [Thermoleophilia bacterium]|nr:cobalamin-dependent protein [Thermoleophilia bacterium]